MAMRKRSIIVLIAVLCMITAQFTAVYADATGKLTVELGYNGVSSSRFDGFIVNIWQVTDNNLVAKPDFTALSIDWRNVNVDPVTDDGEANKKIAADVYARVVSRSVPPTAQGIAGTDGKAHFTGLEAGVYLVAARDYSSSPRYVFSQFVVMVSEDGEAVTIPKSESRIVVSGDPRTVEPSVTVGSPEVPLVEQPPEGPPVIIPDDDTPLTELPQTGVLRWPIPVLAVTGILLIAIGCLINRRGKRANAA